MRVFVTGATGYVGQALCERLTTDGEEVTALVRRADSRAASRLRQWGVALVEGDLSDVDRLLDARQDAVVHLACSLFPTSDRRTNVTGSLNLLRAVQGRRIGRVVYTSSTLVYGPTNPHAMVDEGTPCRPTLRFARQQREVEEALLSAAEGHGLPCVILRPSEVWGGQGGTFDGTVNLLRRGQLVLASRQQNLSLTELSDLVDAIVTSLQAPLEPGTVLNVGSPRAVDTHRLYDCLADVLGVARARRLPLAAIYAAAAVGQGVAALRGSEPGLNLEIARLAGLRAGPRSIERARSLLGFSPRVHDPLPEIVRRYQALGAHVAPPPRQETL